MWAHAEYIKLLRSAADGQVFDRIPIVAERYLNSRGRKDLEIWKPMRRVRAMAARRRAADSDAGGVPAAMDDRRVADL